MSNQPYALAEDHWNVHTNDYDTVFTALRTNDMNGITKPDDIAAALLKSFIQESHKRPDAEPTPYAPQQAEYRVRLFPIDPAILHVDEGGDETLPDGFQPDGAPVAIALWQVNEKN